jgi:hypothetical protein
VLQCWRCVQLANDKANLIRVSPGGAISRRTRPFFKAARLRRSNKSTQ